MIRRVSCVIAVAAALAVPVAGGVAAPAAPAGERALREAARLADTWGRCPTSRPAHAALAAARRATGPRRAPAARRALTAWRAVVVECSVPVPAPVAG